MSTQLAFDFAEPAAAALSPARPDRSSWRTGMVTSLPLFCNMEGGGQSYTYMLPGVIEEITGNRAAVRIYAAPEFGYIHDDYPLHLHLAVDVPLRELGNGRWYRDLQRIANEGLLTSGDAVLAAEVRARASLAHARAIGKVAA